MTRRFRELISLPPDEHWFCPRSAKDEHANYYDEDVLDRLKIETEDERRERRKHIARIEETKRLVFDSCQIIAFDGSDAEAWLAKFKKSLEIQLSRCSVCVRQYHRSRADLKHRLDEDYEEEQVQVFMVKYDEMNKQRIKNGLDSVQETLLELPPDERKITALAPTEMYALFETMHCMPILQDEQALHDHFDLPFRLVQTKSKISLPEYTPALTAFLFSYNDDRRQWASRGWKRFKREITGSEFDHTVRDNLRLAAGRVGIMALEKDFMPYFWSGVRTIVEKLDQNLITHHLRAMGTDLFKLALDHLQVHSQCFFDLLSTLQLLLEKSPNDVWDAFGAISPQTVMEQIFNSPNLAPLMSEQGAPNTSALELALGWVEPFITSIKAGNLPPVCRSILHQLWTRLQKDGQSHTARRFCWGKGVQALNSVLVSTQQHSRQAGSASIAGMLEVVRAHISPMMQEYAKLRSTDSGDTHRAQINKVIENALALDLTLLVVDREALVNVKPLGHDQASYSPDIWKTAVRTVKTGDVELASSIVVGVRRLLALEPLSQKQVEAAKKPAIVWNEGRDQIQSCIVELLERMQDFESKNLEVVFSLQESASGFFTLLFSESKEVQQAAAAVLKVVTSESSRRDAIRVIIEKFFGQSLRAMSANLRVIARLKVFAPSMMVLKIGRDFFESLCNSQDGVLRTRSLVGDEANVAEFAWQSLWLSISGIFETTEAWSQLGHEKNMMIEFCRDSMDFADSVFNQYSIFAGALESDASKKQARTEVEQRLLEAPNEAAGHIVKWLRLRDEYLIAKAVSLTSKLMRRLEDVDMELPESASDFINSVVSGGVKNKLNVNQRAELRRALESHLGQPTSKDESSDMPLKTQKQGSLASWMSSGTAAVPTPAVEKKNAGLELLSVQRKDAKGAESGHIAKLMAGITPAVEKFKAGGGLQTSRSVAPAMQNQAQRSQRDVEEFKRKRREEQEAREKQKAAIVAASKRVGRGIGDAGSGLAGIGVEGKDHAVKGEGVMVSSDESSDGDDDLDEELFGSKSKPLKRKNTVKEDAAGVIGLKREQKQGPVRIQRQVRSQKDMRARLQPDLAPLHKTILGWDFFHDGEFPPNSNDWQFSRVSKSFRHVNEYRDTFQPLLQLEAWQGFVRSREEGSFKPFEIKVANRSSVDAFVEVSTTITHAENREIQVSEGDIVLFSSAEKPTNSPDAPHCLSRVYKINRKKQFLEVVYRVMPGNSLNSALTPGSLIYGTKIQSITPLEREYSALAGLQYYDLCDEIIKAKPSYLQTYADRQLDPLIANYNVNKAQAKAIRSALDNDAFTLIQGPPGSGKTKTIVAIVGGILSETLTASSTSTRISVPKASHDFQSAAMTSKKLLVCAPSNAAVDELVMRLKDGIKTLKGVHKNLNVVRLGRSDAINSAVVDVTMDELVKQRMGNANGDNNAREKTQALMKEHQKVSEQLRLTREKLDDGEAIKGEEHTKLQDEFHQLRRRKNNLGTQIDNAKDAENAASRTVDLERRKIQQAVLDESHVICATLSGSGHEMFQSLNIEFETVIVDEAAQCVEVSALIPLKYGCAKCILVGDPKQLPPTVFSKQAAKFQYEQSLFVRMQSNFPDYVHLLDTQYRMHPDISAFPSATFYDGRLLDGNNMEALRRQVWHKSSLLAPYRFFDVQGQHQAATKGHSLINRAEIEVALALYERLTKDFEGYDFRNRIGIITPYKSQLRELKDRFSSRYGCGILESVEFNTTDAFQGRESEVIIFSCVRASPAGTIGFLQDIRRMNVGLTRAKSSLWVLGNSQSLMRGEYWKKLVVDAQERDVFTSGDLMGMLHKPSSMFPAKPRPKSKAQAVQSAEQGTKVATPVIPNGNDHRPASGHSDPRPRKPPAPLPMFQSQPAHRAKISNTNGTSTENTKVKLEHKLDVARSSDTPDSDRTGRDQKSTTDNVHNVKMEDAVDSNAGSSRTSTPQPYEHLKAQELQSGRSATPASASGDDVKSTSSHRMTPQPSGAPVPPRKRKAANVFMSGAKHSRKH